MKWHPLLWPIFVTVFLPITFHFGKHAERWNAADKLDQSLLSISAWKEEDGEHVVRCAFGHHVSVTMHVGQNIRKAPECNVEYGDRTRRLIGVTDGVVGQEMPHVPSGTEMALRWTPTESSVVAHNHVFSSDEMSLRFIADETDNRVQPMYKSTVPLPDPRVQPLYQPPVPIPPADDPTRVRLRCAMLPDRGGDTFEMTCEIVQ